VPAIKEYINLLIDHNDHADLRVVQEHFRCNPIALRNLVEYYSEGWGLVLTQGSPKVYPMRSGDRLNG
jgi:hypothetical protein